MQTLDILRRSALDLISAAGFLGIWLLRDHFEYDTLRSLLFWPLVFEMYLAIALFLAGMSSEMRSGAARGVWCLALIGIYLFAAWFTGADSGVPQIWTIALWLLLARIWPPRGIRPGSRDYSAWLQVSAGYTGMLWGAGFIVMMLLVLVVPPSHTETLADGSLRSTSQAWIFPLVWTPYFIAEAVFRARRAARKT
ncbi:MAG: hypothetical protein ABI866_00340 [Dokdonella sp.]